MFKKLLILIASGVFFNTTAQVIENFETGSPSLQSAILRNQNNIPFTSIQCNISPLTGTPFMYAIGANPIDNPSLKVSLVSQGNYEPLLLSHGVQMYTVPPNGGKYAIRLNDTNTNLWDISSYTKTFIPKGEYVSFDYLAVLDSPHFNNLEVQPFFTARLLDEQDNIIPNTQFCLIADTNDPLLSNPSRDLLFSKDWFCGMIKIPQKYIGKRIKIQFLAADCGWGGDIGVAYVDNVTNEVKCDKPTYGYVNLDEMKYPCPKDKFKVCGYYSEPQGSTLQSLILEIKQNGNVINTIDISNGFYDGGRFCFYVDPSDFQNLMGEFEFNVIATFIASNGFVYVLNHESSIDGPDLVCECPKIETIPIKYTIENIDYVKDRITWDPFGNGNYHVQLSQDYNCCGPSNYPNDNIIIDYFVPTNSFITEDAGYHYYNQGGSNIKCFRWRVKIDECTWSEWCCVTLTGNYDGYDCKRSTDDFFTNSNRSNATAYPNPTNDFVIIENSNAIIFDVYDLNNKKLKANLFDKNINQIKINMGDLKPGIYIIKSNLGEEFKIIKQ